MDNNPNDHKVLRSHTNWKDLFFYQKADALYQLTFSFCDRFLPEYGDRTVDQMVQAARSGKQNIIEGSEDGLTSTEMELKLLNVARASVHELREDYRDYLVSRHLYHWRKGNPRYAAMQQFTSQHNRLEDYQPYFTKWNDEEMANIGYALCCQVDALMNGYLEKLERTFVEEGGIKERMHRARTGYRQEQDARLKFLEAENAQLKQKIQELEQIIARLKG